MKRHWGIIRGSAAHVANAARGALDAYRSGRVEHEPEITDRMIGAIEQAMQDFEINGVRWTAKTLTSRGRGSQEVRFGADFVGVLEINLPDYQVQKGFLAQAKRIDVSDQMDRGEFDRMRRQCEKMLELSPDSFVFLYSRDDITIVPAISVLSTKFCNPHELYGRNIARFYEEHFECFIGDREISSPSQRVLEEREMIGNARRLLYLAARQ